MDALTLLIWVAFYALFFFSIRRYLRHRSPVNQGLMLVFSSTAALFALSAVNTFYPPATPYVGPVLVTLLVAQPALMIWLAGRVVRLPRWVTPVAGAGCAAVVVAYYATNRSLPSIFMIVGYFFATDLIAATLFVRESFRRYGLARVRLALAGIGSLLFGASIVLSGLSSVARGGGGADASLAILTRTIALLAGLSYLAAFAPPHWLLRLAHRALAFDLIRSIVTTPSGAPERLWLALADAAGQILGTPRVRIAAHGRQLVEGPGAPEPPEGNSPIVAPAPGGSGQASAEAVEIPLIVDGAGVATLSATLDDRVLFVEDDLALIRTLGLLTATAVERERAIAEANRTVVEAAAIRASEGRFRALLDAEPNAILAVDHRGRIRWATRSAGLTFGVPDGALVGRQIDEVIPGRLPIPHPALDGREVAGEPIRFEAAARRADGAEFPAEIVVNDFEYDGEPLRHVVVSDVTWRHEADAMRERFIGVLSHELRTPITAIFGGTQVLLGRSGKLDRATEAELLSDIAGEAERLQRMIENLLVLARVERGTDVADVDPVLIHRILPEVLAREQLLWPGMRLTAEVPATLPVAAGDEASLSLVLRNLISNAGKYAGADAVVQVIASVEPDGAIAIRVLDDGPGLNEDDAERLFDLYFRSTGKHAVPGSGIGLFVCRQLVTAMGGRTWAASRAEGGAEFGFTLPIHPEVDGLAGSAKSVRPESQRVAAALTES
jgi:PAS domain S-box-containing protein